MNVATIEPSQEVVYQGGTVFQVLGSTIRLYSELMDYGYSTVAEIDGVIHYVGDEPPSLTTAIFAWEDTNNRFLTKEELRGVLKEHQLL